MKAPFLWLALGLTSGILFSIRFAVPSFWIWFCLFLNFPILWLMRGKRLFTIFFVIAAALLGMAASQLNTYRPPHAVERFTGSRRISLEGVVAGLPEIKKEGRKVTVSFVLDSKNLVRRDPKNGDFPSQEFFETQGFVQVFLYQPAVLPEAGDRIRLRGVLEKPRRVLNPGEFDYGRYLGQQKIYAILKGYGRYSLLLLEKDQTSFFFETLMKVRRKIEIRIDRIFKGQQAVLLKALILGRRKGLSPEIRDDFMKTGTSHLLAISGLNISLVAGTLYLALLLLGLHQRPAALLGLGMVILYTFIAGYGITVQRAAWMACFGFLSLLLERPLSSLNSFFLAYCMLLLVDPMNLTQVSFQLSFLSVFCLMIYLKPLGIFGNWDPSLAQTLAVTAGTFPLVLYYFNMISLVSLFANMLAVPLFHLCSLFSFPSLAGGDFPILGNLMARLTSFILEAALGWIRLWARARWGFFFFPRPSWIQMLSYYVSLALLTFGCLESKKENPFPLFRSLRFRKVFLGAAGVIWVVSTVSFFHVPKKDQFELTFFAAGKNEIAHIQFDSRRHWLVNLGRGFPSDQGQWILNPYLRSKGVKKISGVLITHFDANHTGGAASLLRNFTVDYFVRPRLKAPKRIFGAEKVRHFEVNRGSRIRIQGKGEFNVLEVAGKAMACQVSYQGWDFLFLPELNQALSRSLRHHQKALLDTEVLILPAIRHFDPALWNDFFGRVDPKVVVMPDRNAQMAALLADRDIPLLDSMSEGALMFQVKFPLNEKQIAPLELSSFLKGKLFSFSDF